MVQGQHHIVRYYTSVDLKNWEYLDLEPCVLLEGRHVFENDERNNPGMEMVEVLTIKGVFWVFLEDIEIIIKSISSDVSYVIYEENDMYGTLLNKILKLNLEQINDIGLIRKEKKCDTYDFLNEKCILKSVEFVDPKIFSWNVFKKLLISFKVLFNLINFNLLFQKLFFSNLNFQSLNYYYRVLQTNIIYYNYQNQFIYF